MLIVPTAKKDSDSGCGLTILEYSRIVYHSELPIPSRNQKFSFEKDGVVSQIAVFTDCRYKSKNLSYNNQLSSLYRRHNAFPNKEMQPRLKLPQA